MGKGSFSCCCKEATRLLQAPPCLDLDSDQDRKAKNATHPHGNSNKGLEVGAKSSRVGQKDIHNSNIFQTLLDLFLGSRTRILK